MATMIVMAIGLTGTAAVVATIVLSVAISAVMASLFAPDQDNTSQKDPGVKSRVSPDTSNKLPIIYGRQKIKGTTIMADMSTDSKKMAFIIALCHGDIQGVDEVKWEDKILSFSGDITTGLRSVTNAVDVDGNSQSFLNSGRLKIKVYLNGGRCSEMESFSALWASGKTNRNMPDTPYFYCEITYDREEQVTRLGDISFIVRGKKVQSINADATLGSRAYSTNPAECFLDYMLDEKSGMGIPLSSIDTSSLKTLKDFCDVNKSYTDKDGVSATAKRYTCNGIINTNQDTDRNLSDLLSGCQSTFTYTLGKFGVVVNSVKASSHSFSEENIFGSLTITDSGFDNIVNDLTIKYTAKNNNFQQDQVSLVSPSGVMNTNEPHLEKTLTYPFINNNIEAERVGTVLLNQLRQNLLVEFNTDISALTIQAGDVVQVSHSTPGWNSKLFRVLSIEESSVEGGDSIGLKITALEYADEVYDDLSLNERDVAPNTNLLDPNTSILISSITMSENTDIQESNLLVSWTSSPSSYVERYELRHKLNGTADAEVYVAVGNGSTASLTSLVANSIYKVEIRAVSTLGKVGLWYSSTKTTGPARSVGLTQKGDWPTTGIVTINPGDIYVYGGDLWFFTGGTSISLDASSTNPSADNTANNRWRQVDIPPGTNGLTAYVWVRVKDGALQWQTTNSSANPDPSASPAWEMANTTGVNVTGADGAAGVDGTDGSSIIWKGSLSSSPASPATNWAYYNTTDNKSYIYKSGTWYLMTVDGVDGQDGNDGTNGISMVWKGASANPPASPVTNWVYRDTDNGYIYIYNGTAWELMVLDGSDGTDGSTGTDGNSVYITYNDSTTTPSNPTGNGTTSGWHTAATAASIWMSQKVAATAADGTWGSPIKIKGEDGTDGTDGTNGDSGDSVYVATVYKRATSQPTKPTGGSYNFSTNALAAPTGWSGSILAGTDPIWASNASFSVTGSTGTDSTTTWTNAALLAESGTDGTDGVSGRVLIVYADDATGTNKSTTMGTRQWVLYHEYTGATPAVSTITGTWVKFVGADGVIGSDGASIWVIYSVDSAGNSQSFTASAAREYVTFYEASSSPTLPVSGQTWLKYIGADGVDGSPGTDGSTGTRGPGRFSKSIGVTTAPAVGSSTFNTHARGSITDVLGSGVNPVAGDIVVITYTQSSGSIVTRAAVHDGTGIADNDWGTFSLQIDGSLLVNGTVAGTAINSATSVTAGTGNNVAVMSGSDSNYRFYAGNSNPSSAPFKVDKTGKVTISSSTSTTTSRLVIDNDQIKVYEGNQLKVLIGRL